MQSLEVLEVILLDLFDLVVLQVQQCGLRGDLPGDLRQTWLETWELNQEPFGWESSHPHYQPRQPLVLLVYLHTRVHLCVCMCVHVCAFSLYACMRA